MICKHNKNQGLGAGAGASEPHTLSVSRYPHYRAREKETGIGTDPGWGGDGDGDGVVVVVKESERERGRELVRSAEGMCAREEGRDSEGSLTPPPPLSPESTLLSPHSTPSQAYNRRLIRTLSLMLYEFTTCMLRYGRSRRDTVAEAVQQRNARVTDALNRAAETLAQKRHRKK